MITITIDGKKVETEKGTYLLKIARELGIYIPTLCYHEALESYGACRLCVVEVTSGKRVRMVTSCNFPASDGIVVRTDSERVRQARKILLELLMARSSNVPELKQIAAIYGIEGSRFGAETEKCILCGLCARVCNEIIGACAINFSSRGIDRKISTPFIEPSSTCIGCGACVYVCPTGAITLEDVKGLRVLKNWEAELPLKKCAACGGYITAEKQFEEVLSKLKIKGDYLNLCSQCRRDSAVKELTKTP